jgi:hypothetical protein
MKLPLKEQRLWYLKNVWAKKRDRQRIKEQEVAHRAEELNFALTEVQALKDSGGDLAFLKELGSDAGLSDLEHLGYYENHREETSEVQSDEIPRGKPTRVTVNMPSEHTNRLTRRKVVCENNGSLYESVRACAAIENLNHKSLAAAISAGRPYRGKIYKYGS